MPLIEVRKCSVCRVMNPWDKPYLYVSINVTKYDGNHSGGFLGNVNLEVDVCSVECANRKFQEAINSEFAGDSRS